MHKAQAQVEEFQQAFGQATMLSHLQEIPSQKMACLAEELAELLTAWSCGDRVGEIDALCDLLYFLYGCAIDIGEDLEPYFDAVHRNNMNKVWPDGTVHKRPDGKVIKPEGFVPVDLHSIYEEIHHG